MEQMLTQRNGAYGQMSQHTPQPFAPDSCSTESENMAKVLGACLDLTAQLRARLEPVLRPSSPASDTGGASGVLEPPAAPFVYMLRGHVSVAQMLARTLMDINERIAL